MTEFSREFVLRQALGRVITDRRDCTAYGLVVQGIDDVPIRALLDDLGGPGRVYVSLVGVDGEAALVAWARSQGWDAHGFGIGAAHAVAIRNSGTVSDNAIKLVFVDRDDRRTHSLTRRGYEEIGPDDVIDVVCRMGADAAPNVPQAHLWEALRSPKARVYLSLQSLLDYYVGVFQATDDTNNIPRRLLPVLGLLPDQQLLAGTYTSVEAIAKRLEDNGRTVEQLQQADEQDREKAVQKVSASVGADREHLRDAYAAFLRIARNDRRALADLDLTSAKNLLTKSTPPRSAPPPPPDPTRETAPPQEESEDAGEPADPSVRYASLDDAALDLSATGNLGLLERFVDKVQDYLTRDAREDDDLREGSIVVPFTSHDRALELVRHLTTETTFGGRLDATEYPLAVVMDELGRHLERVDTFDVVRIRKLQELLARTKEMILPAFEGEALLASYLEACMALLPYRDVLVTDPLACLTAKPAAFAAAQAAIAAYERLLSHIEDTYLALRRRSREGAHLICRDILSLDMCVIDGQDDRAVVISTISPLALWKYVELAALIRSTTDTTSARDPALASLVHDVPEPLLAICLPGDHADDAEEFGFATHLARLPVYRPVTVERADLGEQTIRIAATKLATLYPPVKDALRIVLVNPHATQQVSRAVEKLVLKDGFRHVNVVIARTHPDGFDGIGSEDTLLDHLAVSGVLTIEEAATSSPEGLTAYLTRRPAHLLCIAGERRRNVDLIESEATRLHPISLPRRLHADPLMGTVSLQPRSIQPADDGPRHPFGLYQSLVSQIRKVHSEYSLHESPSTSSEQWEDLLPLCQFLLVAGDVPKNTNPASLRLTQGIEIYGDTVFTYYAGRIRHGIDMLLRQLNYEPSPERLQKLLTNLQALGGDGLFATISDTGTHGFLESALRGQLGLAVALSWYQEETGAQRHVALSLDSHLARQWLQKRDDGRRTDLLGFREMDGGALAIDIIEVKSYEATHDDVMASRPAQQLRAVAGVIHDILHHQGNILIDCRRELLRRLIYREGLLPNPPRDLDWIDILNQMIDGDRDDVTINLVLIELAFEQNVTARDDIFPPTGDVATVVDGLSVRRLRLGEHDIQRHLQGVVERGAAESGPAETAAEERDDDTSVHDDHPQTGQADSPNNDAPFSPLGDATREAPDARADAQPSAPVLGYEPTTAERAEMAKTAHDIYRVLQDIGIRVVGQVDPTIADVGPSIVRYKVKVQTDVRTRALESRARDLMRELALDKEPIIDVLPGTPYMYLDLPRRTRHSVRLVPYLEHLTQRREEPGLFCPLGVTPDGHVEWLDITQPPHTLVAGSTGSGKTMFLYSLIVGLTYLYTPADLQLVLIDPKQTDFVFFNGLPHLRGGTVITDAQEAVERLMLLIKIELERRTETLKEARCRDIRAYNVRHPERAMAPLVVMIDEFADLADVMDRRSREDFDMALKRLAQRARNVGIHLVIATQRPTADIVNGNLKSNLPCRISFRLASQVDSRTILDASGAEHLLGNGDMLYSNNGRTVRLQGFYLPDDDIADIVGRFSV